MKEFENYIMHKIALSVYNMYEDMLDREENKRLGNYYSAYDYARTISIHFKNVGTAVIMDEKEEKIVKKVLSRVLGDIEDIYGIKDEKVGVMIFDFFYYGKWGEWMKIVSDTKRYFGV